MVIRLAAKVFRVKSRFLRGYAVFGIRITGYKRKMLVVIIAAQQAGFYGAQPPVGSYDTLSYAVVFDGVNMVGAQYRQKVEKQDQF